MIAVFLAAFEDWRQRLAPGERGVVMIVAADRKQARVIFRYAEALVDGVPMLANMVTRRTSENGGDKLVHGSGGISQPRAE